LRISVICSATARLSLTATNQLAFNRFLANEAHVRGVSVALGNEQPAFGDAAEQVLEDPCGGGLILSQEGTPLRRERELHSSSVRCGLGPTDQPPPDESVHGFARGGIADCQKICYVTDAPRVCPCDELKDLELGGCHPVIRDFPQLLLHPLIDGG